MSESGDLTKSAVKRLFGAEELHKLAVETLPRDAPLDQSNAFVFGLTGDGLKVGLHFRKNFEKATFDFEGAFLHNINDGSNRVGFNSVLWF